MNEKWELKFGKIQEREREKGGGREGARDRCDMKSRRKKEGDSNWELRLRKFRSERKSEREREREK